MSSRLLRYSTYRLGVGLLLSMPGLRAAAAVTDAPAVAPAPIVDKPLAPAANDTPGDQPTAQHVWVPGHWRWLEGAYVWEAGRWDVPPAPNVTWNAPQWQQQGSGYILREGYWDEAPPAPMATAEPQGTVVTQPPPLPMREPITERPMGTSVWLTGYWEWRDGRYTWTPGRWANPPRANAMWMSPRWEQRGNGYVFVSGYWRDAMAATPAPMPEPSQPQVVYAPAPPPQQQVVVVTAPPPPRHEVIYGRPSPFSVWIDGYWAWRGGRHVWMAGHWETPPRGYRSWVPARWDHRGGSYVFIEGHWGR